MHHTYVVYILVYIYSMYTAQNVYNLSCSVSALMALHSTKQSPATRFQNLDVDIGEENESSNIEYYMIQYFCQKFRQFVYVQVRFFFLFIFTIFY